MRKVFHSVSIATDNAKGYDTDKLSASDKVTIRNGMYVISGEKLLVDRDDLATPEGIAAVNKVLLADLGRLQRTAADGSGIKGQPVDLCYVVNNGGLALKYGDAIKKQFAKRTVSADEMIQLLGLAVSWASTEAPELLIEAGTDAGREALVAAYKESRE